MITKAVVFDADGVLLDSLPPHLQICRDLAQEYEINVTIPSEGTFKSNYVRKGIKISPMDDFFRAVGFIEKLIAGSVDRYNDEFAHKYGVKPFPGVKELFDVLKRDGIQFGIVSSNTFNNVVTSLGVLRNYFDDRFIITREHFESKPEGINEVLRRMGVDPDDATYVGDQRSDQEASDEVGSMFVGVTYGWGIDETDTDLLLARSIADVARYVRK